MGFMQRELDKLNKLIHNTPNDSEASQPLQAMRQVLSWSLEPEAFMSPSAWASKFYGAGNEGTKGTGIRCEDVCENKPQC